MNVVDAPPAPRATGPNRQARVSPLAALRFAARIRRSPGTRVLGVPAATVIAFACLLPLVFLAYPLLGNTMPPP